MPSIRCRAALRRSFSGALAVVLLLGAGPSAARMYQWLNPKTGLSQLSGNPPAWYRSGQSGPRILVYDAGVLVDDTALRVSEEKAEALRQAAFDEVERLLELQRLEEAARREAAQAERALAAAASPAADSMPSAEPETDAAQPGGTIQQFGADTIERLKAIIEEFDRLGGEVELPPATSQ